MGFRRRLVDSGGSPVHRGCCLCPRPRRSTHVATSMSLKQVLVTLGSPTARKEPEPCRETDRSWESC
jgi:hypothetical protein